METFGVDKPLYEIEDFNDLWSTESFDSPMSDIDLGSAGGGGDDDSQDCWGSLLSSANQSPTVILNDRMMTDAAHSPRPIAIVSLSSGPTIAGTTISSLPPSYQSSDHSYSMTNGTANDSTADNNHIKIEYDKDLDTDCLLAVPMNSINHNNNMVMDNLQIKSEPPSPPSSPSSGSSGASSDFESFDSSESLLSTNNYSSYHQSLVSTPSSHHPQSLLKQPTIVLATRQNSQNNQSQRRMVFPKVNIKVEPQGQGFLLPPTPPSSSNGSDSESSGSPSPSHPSVSPSSISSSKAHHSQSHRVLTASVTSNTSNMKSLNSPLISTQPKGATGMLLLTEEEKRTLIAEGYPIPQRLPLTKAEEKSLKKIRRKIKNKISAQESRRKKKEYMDTLEKKVEILQNENSEYKRRVDNLESSNQSLLSQLHELQMLVGETPSKIARLSSSQSTSCLMPKKPSTSKSGVKL